MPVRIRLSRHGRKGRPFYYVVVADSRAPRDGKFIEKLGTYNPMTDPATLELNFERALHWVMVGAQPSDTVRSLLSREGVMLKKHLLEGVRKGALSDAEVETKFEIWKKEKENQLKTAADKKAEAMDTEAKKRFAKESKVREERAKELAAKNSELAKALGIKVEPKIEAPVENTEAAENAEAATEEEPKAE